MKRSKKHYSSTRYNFNWWLKNLLVVVLAYLLLPPLIKLNLGYNWIIEGYAKANVEICKRFRYLTNDQRLEMKLGYDYAFLEMIRSQTPPDAVVYYPSRKDFMDNKEGSDVVFSGNLCDKLSAVRFLYPRRVVIEKEREKTSWGKKIDYISIVNGHGLELLPYKVDPEKMSIGVLPVNKNK